MRTRVVAVLTLSAVLSACSGGLKAGASIKADASGVKVETEAKTTTGTSSDESSSATTEKAPSMDEVLSGAHRSEEHRARDKYRHPKETLEFFGLRPDMHVLEIEPDSAGWYIEILAPYLAPEGKLTVTNYDPKGPPKSPLTEDAIALQNLLESSDVFSKVETIIIEGRKDYTLGQPGSIDMVLAVRNLHLWKQDRNEARVYKAIFDVLKPGGVFCVVQHRANAGDKADKTYRNGYLPQPYVVSTVKEFGFEFEAESHINANSWDTKDYPRGVWSLPPVLAMGKKDQEKYLEIGESDRMTLRFRKPASAPEPASDEVPQAKEEASPKKPEEKAKAPSADEKAATETKAAPEKKPALGEKASAEKKAPAEKAPGSSAPSAGETNPKN